MFSRWTSRLAVNSPAPGTMLARIQVVLSHSKTPSRLLLGWASPARTLREVSASAKQTRKNTLKVWARHFRVFDLLGKHAVVILCYVQSKSQWNASCIVPCVTCRAYILRVFAFMKPPIVDQHCQGLPPVAHHGCKFPSNQIDTLINTYFHT